MKMYYKVLLVTLKTNITFISYIWIKTNYASLVSKSIE